MRNPQDGLVPGLFLFAGRLGQYVPGSALATGLYSWSFQVTGSPNDPVVFKKYAAVIGNDSSSFGAGWSLSGLDHLYFNSDGSVMWDFGANASPAVFAVNSVGQLVNPANFYGTLSQNEFTLAWTEKEQRVHSPRL
jgi:hypothetical protein